MKRSVCALLAALLCGAVTLGASSAAEVGLVARYTFDEDVSARVVDSSGNRLDGVVIGSAQRIRGVRGNGVAFDGLNRISVAPFQAQGISTLLNLDDQLTLTAWVRGHGGEFRLVRPPSSYSSIRGPDFQVCGDVIHLAFNSDHPSRENPNRQGNDSGLWNDWHVWTGTVDINLTNWRDRQRTFPPFSGVEPKLVVHGGRIFYEYFGQDANGVWQIHTAQSSTDGSDWRTTQRTYEVEGYRTEQSFNLQVAAGRIHYAWEQKGATVQWQMWTASSALDGSDFKTMQRTTDGGGIPQLQVVGSRIYYLYPTPVSGQELNPRFRRLNPTFAVSELDGSGWRVLRTIEDHPAWHGGTAAFQVSNGRIYFTYNRVTDDNYAHLFTGDMDIEGQDLRSTQKTFGRGNSASPQGGRGMQVVGGKIYYIFTLDNGRLSVPEIRAALQNKEEVNSDISVWTAVSNLDGSNWKATKRTAAPPSVLLGYQGIQLVGGKAYYAGFESPPIDTGAGERGDRYRAVLGTSGSNIISKGDAYGIGLNELNEISGFINAGQGYLYRGEAPQDTSGAVADYMVDDRWHHVAVTYDRKSVKLYVDGQIKSSVTYHTKVGRNPFPLLVGDGFHGSMDEVSVYARVATAQEIAEWYREGAASLIQQTTVDHPRRAGVAPTFSQTTLNDSPASRDGPAGARGKQR